MNQQADIMNTEIQIDDYDSCFEEQVVSLLCELQSYLVDIDPEKIQVLSEDYRLNYLPYVLESSYNNRGSVLIARNNEKVIGFVAGMLETKDQEDKLTNRCPSRGIINELVVSHDWRGKGVGRFLVEIMESRFVELKCEYSVVNVFEPNKSAQCFYEKLGYRCRNIEMFREISINTETPNGKTKSHPACIEILVG